MAFTMVDMMMVWRLSPLSALILGRKTMGTNIPLQTKINGTYRKKR